jgi:hypothetical protein
MADPRLTSPPSILVYDPNSDYDRRRPSFNSSSHNICAETASSRGMAIPSVNDNFVPPPLPPPRRIADLELGHDQGWKWGNQLEGELGQNTLAPIKPNSSLHGGHIRPPELVRRNERFSVDEVGKGRNGISSTKHSLGERAKTEPSQSWEEAYSNSLASNMSSPLSVFALLSLKRSLSTLTFQCREPPCGRKAATLSRIHVLCAVAFACSQL